MADPEKSPGVVHLGVILGSVVRAVEADSGKGEEPTKGVWRSG